jgi:hypothetical protein
MSKEQLYTLMPLEEFKSVIGIDDREDKLARFCLVTSTLTIEQYCKRKFLRKKYFEKIEFNGDLFLPFLEYPVSKLLAVYALSNMGGSGEIVEPEFYSVVPDFGTDYDLPFAIELSPALKRYPALSAVKAVYWAGYQMSNEQLAMSNERGIKKSRFPVVPGDLAAACMELASWNMSRYRGRRVGMTGNIRGAGKEGEHFELSMPENVKALLEPYRRKTV